MQGSNPQHRVPKAKLLTTAPPPSPLQIHLFFVIFIQQKSPLAGTQDLTVRKPIADPLSVIDGSRPAL